MARAAKPAEKTNPDATMRIVVLHGHDDFLISARTRMLAERLREQFGEIEEFEFDGEAATLAQVLDELRSYGLMQRFKLVKVDNADSFLKRDGHREAMERYAAAPMPEATLLLRASTWHKGKIDALIEKVGAIIVCESPPQARAAQWCVDRAVKAYQCTVEPAAAAMLVERVGNDLSRLDSELGKLACMVDEGQAISPQLVREAVGLSREEQAWSLQSVILEGDAGAALRRLTELVQVSRAPKELLMWSVTDLIRRLHSASAFLRDGLSAPEVSKALRLWGSDAALVLNLGKAIPPERWAQLLREAIETDFRSKTGSADPERSVEAMTVAVADSIGARSRR
jgi:DNA polymerase III delta subunit